jgi:hypothetical protein
MATIKDFIVKSGLQIQSTSNAISASTGALQVAGGAGIQGDLWVGGTIFMQGAGLDSVSSTTGTFVNAYITGTNISLNTFTGALTVAGGVGVGGSLYATALYDNSYRVITTGTIGNYSVTGITAGTGTAVAGTTGAVTVWSTDTLQNVTDRGASTTNALTITNSTASTGTNTGALVVTGGVAVGGDLWIGGILHASVSGSSAQADNLNGGAAQEVPYQSATGVTAFSANFKWDNDNQVLKLGAGGTEIGGDSGYGYVKALNVQATSLTNGRLVYSDSTHNLVDSANLTFNGTNLTLGGTGTFTALNINPQNLTNMYIPFYNGTQLADSNLTYNTFNQLGGYQAVFSSSVEAHGFINKNLTQNRLIFTADSQGTQGDSADLTFSGGTLNVPALTASGNVQITSTSTSNTSTQGALVVTGGVGIGQNLNVAGDANIWGGTTFGGSVTFNGPATYVLSTNTVYSDNILELHVPPGGVGAQWGPEGASKDIGLRFHYYNRTSSTDTNAALVLSADSQWLEFYGSGAESNTGTFVGASYGGFKAGQAWLESTANATTSMNSNSALQVDGGAGIVKDLWVGGGIWSNNSPVVTVASLATASVVNSVSAGSGISVSSTTGNITVSNTGVIELTGSTYLGVSSSTGIVTLTNLGVTNLAGGTDITVSAATGSITINNTATLQTVTSRGATSDVATISLTGGTASSGTGNGTLVVTGGVGVSGNLYAGTVYSNSKQAVTDVVPVAGTAITISSVSTSSGKVTFTVNNNGVTSLTAGTDTAISSTTGGITLWNTSTLDSVLGRGNSSSNTISVTNTSASTSTIAGNAISVTGGVGANTFYAATNMYVNGSPVVTEADIGALGVTSVSASTGISVNTTTGAITVTNTGVTSLTGTPNQITVSASTGGVTLSLPSGITTSVITATTTLYATGSAIASGANTGALQVTGGASIDANLYVGTTATVAGTLFRSGAISSPGWLARGIGFVASTATYTDSSLTGAQGLVAINALGRPTISADNSPTYGDAATLYIADAPISAGGATITNPWSLYVAKGSVKIAATTVSSDSVSGALVVGGGVGVGGNLNVSGTGNFAAGGVSIGNTLLSSYTSASISSTSTQNLDTFTTSTYRTARYVVQVVDGSKTHITEMTIFHDYSTVYKDEYGISSNAGELGSFDATLVGSTITLTFTPNYTPAAMIIKASRTAIAA